jgi:hypothetical protein
LVVLVRRGCTRLEVDRRQGKGTELALLKFGDRQPHVRLEAACFSQCLRSNNASNQGHEFMHVLGVSLNSK